MESAPNLAALTNDDLEVVLSGFYEALDGLTKLLKGISKIKKIEEKRSVKLFSKQATENILEYLGDFADKIIADSPEAAEIILKSGIRFIKVASLLNNFNLETAKSDELEEIVTNLELILQDIERLRSLVSGREVQ